MSCCHKLKGCKVPVTLILLVIYTCYLLVGAAVFWALESKAEEELTASFQQDKWDLLRNYTCMDNQTLEKFISGIITAYKNGASVAGNTSVLGTWSFAGSFFFSVTAVTSIGYGNLSPTTVGGRIFCVFFALFGIPLNLILLSRIGQKMLYLVHKCADVLGKKIRWQKATKVLISVSALLIGLLLFLLLPPLLFSSIEGWTYEEGFYYAFITLSTIGFGDYVIGKIPGKEYPDWYRNIVALWILFGLAWLALVINLCLNLIENYRDICHCCQKEKENKELDQELIDISCNGNVQSSLQETEDTEKVPNGNTKSALQETESMESSNTKSKSPD
ncbi:potassium channel subfamily K member 17 [Rhinophrynus dorsalis]